MSRRIACVGLVLVSAWCGGVVPGSAQSPAPARPPLTVTSPNGTLVVTLGLGDHLTWAVSARGQEILRPSRLGLVLADGPTLGTKPVVASTTPQRVNQTLRTVVRIKRAEVLDRFNA